MSTTRELDRIRTEQAAVWDAVSAGWSRWTIDFERAASVVSARLIEMAGLRPGHSVLDFGTGLGEPALTAAEVTGPTGRVLGVDLSPEMVERAVERAAGRGGVEFVVGGVEVVPGGHDAVLSRWVLPLTGDPEATLRALRAALKPGGVLAAAVWGPPPAAPMIALGFATVSSHFALDPPPPGGPGPFALADPGVLREVARQAGFRDISVIEQPAHFTLSSPEEFAAFTLDVLPPRMRAVVDRDPDGVRRALEEAAGRRRTPSGAVELSSVSLLLRGIA